MRGEINTLSSLLKRQLTSKTDFDAKRRELAHMEAEQVTNIAQVAQLQQQIDETK